MKTVTFLMLMLFIVPAGLQADPAGRDDKTQQLVDELKQLTDQAERNRSANYRFIDQLRDLAARYDWPWGQRIIFDDFRDGELNQNPAWHSSSRDFWVTRSVGLRSQLNMQSRRSQPARQHSTEEAIIGMILGGGAQQQPQARAGNIRADISTAARISAAFAITVELTDMGRDNRDGSFEWGPYQGRNMESGYRLVYQRGARPALKLVAYRRNMSAVIEQYDRSNLLGDGNRHKISWQRNKNGMMTVSVDDRQIMRVRDRSYRDAFSGLVLTNRGGDYGLRSIAVFGAGR